MQETEKVHICLSFLKDSWLYHLTVAAGGGTGAVGTDYEQFIAKLMHVNADPSEYSNMSTFIMEIYIVFLM